MRFPVSLHVSLTKYIIKNALDGIKRFPLVLMLEPTHRCNLACAGCDRIRLHNQEQADDLSLEQCIDAALASRAPVVTVTGGEPLLYQELNPLVAELLGMKRHVYLCTNGILTGSFIEEFKPCTELTLNFHIDGMEETHDLITNRAGTFKKTIGAIKKAKQRGFRVSTNTSVYKNSDTEELERLFALLKGLGVDGILISPAFSYERVENNIFLCRDEAMERFRHMALFFKKFPFINSPVYIDFLQGKRQMSCTPWGNPTRNPLGWKSPCYLITDAYYASYRELMEKTPWKRYEAGADPRCRDCMVHSGYEATAMRTAFSHPKDLIRLALWNLKKP
ncbi:MAG: adenosyl-hopene transferase HpnH [Nitrospirae bacterium]|nr:adenosyl-hopene transferase HpnH [Nitrospirota bacterium]MCL5237990.1 adenosyl-hopene transferase HpnH [Nitrospirota bacterium]